MLLLLLASAWLGEGSGERAFILAEGEDAFVLRAFSLAIDASSSASAFDVSADSDTPADGW